MIEAENLVSVARAYASTSGLDEKAAAATDLRAAVLAWLPDEVASAIKVRLNPVSVPGRLKIRYFGV
jgi:hypothetical protein